MIEDWAWVTVAHQAPVAGACELCGAEPVHLDSAVVVRHGYGATVQFLACASCSRAMHRLVAAIGSGARVVAATPTTDPTPVSRPLPRIRPRPRPRVLSAEVLAELSEHFVGDGMRYVVRVCGGPRSDGMWVGWLEYVAIGQRRIRRTGQETTQPNREALLYWATGLEPIYFEGAFSRAH
jgi:hypothetical protein